MTEPMTVPTDAVRELIEERERYEKWLTALEARRGSTPQHVFDRVRADYDARVRGVRERLSEQIVPLRDAEAALSRRLDDVVRTLGDRQDELAELELRTLVGEFAPEDGERRVQQTAAVVRELEADRRTVAEQLEEIRGLLGRADDFEQASSERTPSERTSSEPVASASTAAAGPGEGMEPGPSRPPDVPGAEAERAEAPAAEPWRQTRAEAVATADDEGIVGTGQRLDSLAASLGGSVAPTPAPAPVGQERTLRCQECGEMNYPTEWYCERCGGELAAL
jgi:hypothetical protein